MLPAFAGMFPMMRRCAQRGNSASRIRGNVPAPALRLRPSAICSRIRGDVPPRIARPRWKNSETVSTTVNSVTASPRARARHDLRHALADYFAHHPHIARPDAVSFTTTPDYDGHPAWDTQGPTFHYDQDPDREERRDIPVDQLPDTDFAHTRVAHALTTIGNAEPPQPGGTLRIALPTV